MFIDCPAEAHGIRISAIQPSSQNRGVVLVATPIFNECGTLETLLRAILNHAYMTKLIPVDDHSTGGSFELLEQSGTFFQTRIEQFPLEAGQASCEEDRISGRGSAW